MEPRILDLREVSTIADFFVIMSANSERHVKALINEIEVQFKHQDNIYPLRKEIDTDYKWCILDYGAVLIHVFYYKTRNYYQIERLWGDAEEVPL